MWAKKTSAYYTRRCVRVERSGAWDYNWRGTHKEGDQQHPGLGLRKGLNPRRSNLHGRSLRTRSLRTAEFPQDAVRRQSLVSQYFDAVHLCCTIYLWCCTSFQIFFNSINRYNKNFKKFVKFFKNLLNFPNFLKNNLKWYNHL